MDDIYSENILIILNAIQIPHFYENYLRKNLYNHKINLSEKMIQQLYLQLKSSYQKNQKITLETSLKLITDLSIKTRSFSIISDIFQNRKLFGRNPDFLSFIFQKSIESINLMPLELYAEPNMRLLKEASKNNIQIGQDE